MPGSNQQSGVLAGHVKRGKVFTSPLAATGVLNVASWVRDDLPDLLWPVLVLSELGSDQAVRFVRWQGRVLAELDGSAEPAFLAGCLDGRLSGLQRLSEKDPDAIDVVTSHASRLGLLSEGIRRTLSSYPRRPAEWLTGLEMESPGKSEIDRLATAVLEAMTDDHREAIIKCMAIWSGVQAGTLSSSQETVDLLKCYPNDAATISQADSAIRAMWGAMRAAMLARDSDYFVESIRFSKIFWGVNSMTTRCMRARDVNPDKQVDAIADHSGEPERTEPESSGLLREDFQQRAMDLTSSYVEAVETSASRLYDPSRDEVHTGLVVRAAREVIAMLGSPDLWCSEHGSGVGRTLVENRILLVWMATQNQEEIYRRYKDYGAGKAKLYALLAKGMPSDWLVNGAEEAVSVIERASHNGVLDYREVDISANFAGKSLRQMADECGLADLYRHAYQMQSGISHSEWWSVEIHCMEPCLNVLHRGHLIPSMSLPARGSDDIARSWLIALYGLIRASLDLLGISDSIVHAAFGWLEGVDLPEDAWRRSESDTESGVAPAEEAGVDVD
ncbi:Uncharacterised protein [Mycolicibacterium phlei]|uniref:DUF5677 domain-containing protein n=1 Tax=Mycobacteroides chelonae TaxID=1774 RepID=UPI0009634942|nr:DUF5677 domain-containing protein [Mycobacteroides chelonae]OLT78114.1 hypothetical protein BKG56_14165 [Mycobacteroides chelonae]ORV15058.1 hypothetical protein AWB96_11130 [Mycobacteroides chelonae]VEG16029.1 Uncharacterised protein [Mycolicibacterium phlei]